MQKSIHKYNVWEKPIILKIKYIFRDGHALSD